MNKLLQLVKNIDTHEAVNNRFFEIWVGKKIKIEQIAIFARNYWEFTYRFPESLAILILNADNISARLEYTKTLYSEMGNGHINGVHVLLFENFYKNLSSKLNIPNYLSMDSLVEDLKLLPDTSNFITGQKELYSQEYSIAVGAQLALEWQAYTMVRKLYEGARNYMDLWKNQDEFHEACEFFYVHIGEAEKNHKDESIAAAYKVITSGGDFNKLEYGFTKHLDLIAAFWNGIADEINNCTQ